MAFGTVYLFQGSGHSGVLIRGFSDIPLAEVYSMNCVGIPLCKLLQICKKEPTVSSNSQVLAAALEKSMKLTVFLLQSAD